METAGTDFALLPCMPTSSQPCARSEPSFLIDDAAQLLGVSRRTIYYRIRDGRLRTLRARGGSQRVLLSSIEELLRATSGSRFAQSAGESFAPG